VFQVGAFIRNHTVRYASVIDICRKTESSVASQISWTSYGPEYMWAYAVRRMEAVINEAVISSSRSGRFQDSRFLLGYACGMVCFLSFPCNVIESQSYSIAHGIDR